MSKQNTMSSYHWRLMKLRAGDDANLLQAFVHTYQDGWQGALDAVTKKVQDAVTVKMPDPLTDGGDVQTDSLASLSQMMRDPRYWRDREPAMIRRITEGFAELYPPPETSA